MTREQLIDLRQKKKRKKRLMRLGITGGILMLALLIRGLPEAASGHPHRTEEGDVRDAESADRSDAGRSRLEL